MIFVVAPGVNTFVALLANDYYRLLANMKRSNECNG